MSPRRQRNCPPHRHSSSRWPVCITRTTTVTDQTWIPTQLQQRPVFLTPVMFTASTPAGGGDAARQKKISTVQATATRKQQRSNAGSRTVCRTYPSLTPAHNTRSTSGIGGTDSASLTRLASTSVGGSSINDALTWQSQQHNCRCLTSVLVLSKFRIGRLFGCFAVFETEM